MPERPTILKGLLLLTLMACVPPVTFRQTDEARPGTIPGGGTMPAGTLYSGWPDGLVNGTISGPVEGPAREWVQDRVPSREKAVVTWEVTWPRPVSRSVQMFLTGIVSLEFAIDDASGSVVASGSIVRGDMTQATASCTLEIEPGEGYIARCEAFDQAPGSDGRQRIASASSQSFPARPGRVQPIALRLVPDHPPDIQDFVTSVMGTDGAAIAAPGDEVTLAVGTSTPSDPVVWFPARSTAGYPGIRSIEGVPMIPATPSAVIPGMVRFPVPAGAASGVPWYETRLGARRFPGPLWIPALTITTPTEFFDALVNQNLFLVLDVRSIPPEATIDAPAYRVVTGHIDYVAAAGAPLATLGATPSARLGWKLVQDTVGTLTASGDLEVVVGARPLAAGVSQRLAELEASLAGARSPKLRLGFVKPCDYVPCD